MAKKDKYQEIDQAQEPQEMSLEDARAYRASLYRPAPVQLSEEDRKEEFRIFWARAKSKYGKPKELERTIWLHLKSAKMDSPEQFEAGLAHFGLKKISK